MAETCPVQGDGIGLPVNPDSTLPILWVSPRQRTPYGVSLTSPDELVQCLHHFPFIDGKIELGDSRLEYRGGIAGIAGLFITQSLIVYFTDW